MIPKLATRNVIPARSAPHLREIMPQGLNVKRANVSWSGVCLSLAVVYTGMGGVAAAPASESFEVASVKQLGPYDTRPWRISGCQDARDHRRFVAITSLQGLVEYACDLRPYQYSTPAWMDDATFEVVAEEGENASPEDCKAMLRDRFSLHYHLEERIQSIYSVGYSQVRS